MSTITNLKNHLKNLWEVAGNCRSIRVSINLLENRRNQYQSITSDSQLKALNQIDSEISSYKQELSNELKERDKILLTLKESIPEGTQIELGHFEILKNTYGTIYYCPNMVEICKSNIKNFKPLSTHFDKQSNLMIE